MALVSKIIHQLGVRLLWYLNDWLILASSWDLCLRARDLVLQVCQELGIKVNPAKSILTPSQDMTYLGIVLQTETMRAFPTESYISLLGQIVSKVSVL